jgi:flagellar basal-body rod protein FlgB
MKTMDLIEKALTIRAMNHKVIAGNISNVDTPGYKEKEIDFKAELERTSGGDKNIQVKERTDGDGLNTIDGNTVNIEKQMVKLTENTVMYTTLVQIMTKQFSIMRYIINEGR